MRIGLFTDTYYPEVNGVANSVYQLKKELEKRGHQVYVFTVSNPLQKEKEEQVYRMKSMPFPLLKERRMSCAIPKQWYRTIAGLHLDVIHTQTEFTVGHIGRKAAEKFAIPLIHTYHTIYEEYTHYLKVPGNERLKGVIRNLSRICCDRADEVIVPTEKVKNIIRGYGVTKPIQVQPTGINLGKFAMVDWKMVSELKKQYGLKPEQHVLLSIGRVSQEKNLEEILAFLKEIMAKDIQARLLIVGDGPQRGSLERKAGELELRDKVFFLGEVEWKFIQNYYALGDVFVCASTSETQGLTYIEALASGKPLLVRKDSCLKGVLHSGYNGFSYQTEKEFVKAYEQLFQSDTLLTMSERARESVENLSAKSFGENMERIYKGLLERKAEEGKENYETAGKRNAVAG